MKGPNGVNERTRNRAAASSSFSLRYGKVLIGLVRQEDTVDAGTAMGTSGVEHLGTAAVWLEASVSLWEMSDHARARKGSAQCDPDDLKRVLGVIRGSLENQE